MSEGTTPSPDSNDDTVAFGPDTGPSTPPPASPTPPAPGPVADEPVTAAGAGSTPWRSRPATPARPPADAATERGPIGPTGPGGPGPGGPGPGGPGGPPPRSGGSSSNALTIVAVGGVVVLVVVILLMAVVLGGGDDGEDVSTSDSTTSSTTTTSTTTPTTAPTSAPSTPSTTPPTSDPQLPGVTIVVNDDGDEIAPGLLCEDLVDDGADYDAAVAYWLQEGRPERMDADADGIPCETVYPEADVTAFWGSQETAEDGVQPDLRCADLADQGLDYGAAVAYWEEQGRPARMDEDANGIPCETAYDAADVEAYWGTDAG